MKWPPCKAWSSSSFRMGYKHFVAINYGGELTKRWVDLVSVLDHRSRMKVLWSEMNDASLWLCGWQELSRDQSIEINDEPQTLREQTVDNACLHPSFDSGLLIPTTSSFIRPWQDEDLDEFES